MSGSIPGSLTTPINDGKGIQVYVLVNPCMAPPVRFAVMHVVDEDMYHVVYPTLGLIILMRHFKIYIVSVSTHLRNDHFISEFHLFASDFSKF